MRIELLKKRLRGLFAPEIACCRLSPCFIGNSNVNKELLDSAEANEELQKLRKRRNAIIHVDPDSPAITVDQQWTDRDNLEREARAAVRLMFEAFYIGPWL